MGLHVTVGVPTAIASARVADLHETDAVLYQAPGHQQLPTEIVGRLFADSVKIEDVLGFFREIYYAGRAELHAGRKLIGVDPSGDVGIERMPLTELAVQVS